MGHYELDHFDKKREKTEQEREKCCDFMSWIISVSYRCHPLVDI